MSGEHIPRRDAAVLAAICLLLGGVLSWISFSSPDGVRVPREAGNVADWVAAIAGAVAAGATWVIGSAANRFQREADIRRSEEIEQDKRERVETRIRRYDLMLVRLKRTKTLHGSVSAYHHPDKIASAPAGKCTAAITAVSRLSKLLSWPSEEIVLLPHDCQIHIGNLEVHLVSLDAVSELGLHPDRRGDVEHLRDCIRVLNTICLEIGDLTDILAERIGYLRDNCG